MSNSTPHTYDAAIIGGGLAGLAGAILLRRQGHGVVVIEKERYPHHKVCGEYISRESWSFLLSLGVPLDRMDLPQVTHLLLTAPSGRPFSTRLPLGGFGISRHLLDHTLARLARQEGVVVLEGSKVEAVDRTGEGFALHTRTEAGRETLHARLCLAAYGKRTNLDLRWERGFLKQQHKRLDNYAGIKYHVEADWPDHLIGLHNFEGGYCGISRIEEGRCCLCYLTRAGNLKAHGGDIKRMEAAVLGRNPHLKKILDNSTVLDGFPVAISQISFQSKSQVEDGILMVGDAAGMITPLCGNGMSMALHGAQVAARWGDDFLSGRIDRARLETGFIKDWNRLFGRRLQTGRLVQRFFGSTRLSNTFVGAFRTFPFLAAPLIRQTHGKPF